MKAFFYNNIAQLQLTLERLACRSNVGCCEDYNYCAYCKEPRCFLRKSDTPCADAFLAGGLNYVHCITNECLNRSESHRVYVLYGATLVNVHFIDIKSGRVSPRAYSYIADVPVQIGDIVKVPTARGMKEARVCRVDVPVNEIECKVGELRHITEAATPCGDLFNDFFD